MPSRLYAPARGWGGEHRPQWGVIAFPCRFSLVGAMNPCPCGYLGDAPRACRCTRHQLELHRARLSGLLDRIDKQAVKPGTDPNWTESPSACRETGDG
jgi:magnesium chelatase family protein